MGLAFTCTQHSAVHHIKKENSLIDSLLAIIYSSFPSLPTNRCESVCFCVDAFPSEANRAWQSENKQSADVCVGIVWEIILTRRHFSLIQNFFCFVLSYQVRRERENRLVWDRLKLLHGPAFTTSNWENTTFLKQAEETELLLPLNWLCCCEKATSLCGACEIFRRLPLLLRSRINELDRFKKTQIR